MIFLKAKLPFVAFALIAIAGFLFFSSKAYAVSNDDQSLVISKAGFNLGGNQIIELFNRKETDFEIDSLTISIYFKGELELVKLPLDILQPRIKGFSYYLISSKDLWNQSGSEIKTDAAFTFPSDLNPEFIEAIELNEIDDLGVSWQEDRLINPILEPLLPNHLSELDPDFLYEKLDSANYSEILLDNAEIFNSKSLPAYPQNPVITYNEIPYSPESGNAYTEFKFSFNYKSWHNIKPDEIAINFFDENNRILEAACNLKETSKSDQKFDNGKNYYFICSNLPIGQIYFLIEASDINGGISADSQKIFGPIINELAVPKITFSLKDNEKISGLTDLNWKVDGSSSGKFESELFISKDLADWQKLYSGDGYASSIQSFDYDNGIYYFKISITDKEYPLRSSELIVPIYIENQRLANGDILINEIVSNPHTDEPEWIEVYSNKKELISTQITIWDNSGFDNLLIELDPGEYAIITGDADSFRRYYPDYKGKIFEISGGKIGNGLSNSGDLIKILDISGSLIDEIDFGTGQQGKVYTNISRNWAWQDTASPGEVNTAENKEYPAEDNGASLANIEPDQFNSYKVVAKLENLVSVDDEELIQVRGYAISLPGQIASQYFFVQDGTGGIEIYSYEKDFPNIEIGQELEISGIYNKKLNRLKIENISDIKAFGISEIEPKVIGTSELDTFYNQLVVVRGKIQSKQAHSLTLENGLVIYTTSASKISLSGFKLGMEIEAVGIVDKYSDQFRVYIREKSDIIIISEQEKAVQSSASKGLIKKAQAADNEMDDNTATDLSDEIALAESDEKGVVKGLETARSSSPINIFIAITLALLAIIGIYWWHTLLKLKSQNENNH